jgi:N-carbamoyl-L-amino-acid hydrolase
MLKINEKRLWDSLMEMGRIGALPGGGCRRLALSDEDKAGRDLFVSWCRDSGCEIEVDQIGNIYARRAGAVAGLPAVATGSHLDTQPNGGKFDGVYGVLAGLEVVRSLNDAGVRTRSPIDVIVWTNEEGARFSPPLTGSSVFAGACTVEELQQTITHDGAKVGDELARIGYLGELPPGQRDLAAFFEAHIEQGPVLEAEGRGIGVVSGIQGIRWYSVEVDGLDSHAGTVPMDGRQDALAGAAEMVTHLRATAMATDADIRLTVGRFDVSPNSGSTIPGHVSFNIDLRHPSETLLDEMESAIHQVLQAIAGEQNLELEIKRTISAPPVRFDPDLVALLRQCATALGCSHRDMISGAGHDAMNLASRVATAMVFVPCLGGISHNEAEHAEASDLAAGASVLLNAMVSVAQQAD